MTASLSQAGGDRWNIRVVLRGLDPQGTATLTVTGSGLDLLTTGDGQCTLVGTTGGTCLINTGSAANLSFNASPAAGGPGHVTFVITPNETTDPDLSNNTAEVTFGGAAAALGDTRLAAQRESRAVSSSPEKVRQPSAHTKPHATANLRGDGRQKDSRRHLLRRGWPHS